MPKKKNKEKPQVNPTEICPWGIKGYTAETCQYLQKKLCYAGHIAVEAHHIYFPKRDYQTPLEQEFRDLPEHRVYLCAKEHKEKYHHPDRLYIKPDKPPPELMETIVKQPQYRGELKIEHNNNWGAQEG